MQGEFVGNLDINAFFNTLARLVGEKYGATIIVTSITKKDELVCEKKENVL